MLVRPILEVPKSSSQLHTNVMTDRAILYQRYLEHYQRQLEDEDEEEEQEQEHVHALDLRICKVNESISRNNASDIWQQSQVVSTSESTAPTTSRQSPAIPVNSSFIAEIESGSRNTRTSAAASPANSDGSAGALPPLLERTRSPPR